MKICAGVSLSRPFLIVSFLILLLGTRGSGDIESSSKRSLL